MTDLSAFYQDAIAYAHYVTLSYIGGWGLFLGLSFLIIRAWRREQDLITLDQIASDQTERTGVDGA